MEGEKDQMEAALGELKIAFEAVTVACVHYEPFQGRETDLDVADAFLEQFSVEYITALKKGKRCLKGESDANTGSAMSNNNNFNEVASWLTMPKVSVGTYDGNRFGYPAFIKVFQQSVKGITDDEMKMIQLFDCTKGAVKTAIQPCVFSDNGFEEALNVIKKRFGDAALIIEAILGELQISTPAKTPTELRQLTDELQNGTATIQE